MITPVSLPWAHSWPWSNFFLFVSKHTWKDRHEISKYWQEGQAGRNTSGKMTLTSRIMKMQVKLLKWVFHFFLFKNYIRTMRPQKCAWNLDYKSGLQIPQCWEEGGRAYHIQSNNSTWSVLSWSESYVCAPYKKLKKKK